MPAYAAADEPLDRPPEQKLDRMLLKGEALMGTFTISFAISGKPKEWNISVKAPGQLPTECETEEGSPWALFDEMLVAAYEQCRRISAGARR